MVIQFKNTFKLIIHKSWFIQNKLYLNCLDVINGNDELASVAVKVSYTQIIS